VARESTAGRKTCPGSLVTPRPVKERHRLLEAVDRPTIVALELVGYAEKEIRHPVQDTISIRRGKRKGIPGGGNGSVIRSPAEGLHEQTERDLYQPTRVVEGPRERFGITQSCKHAPIVAERAERRVQGESEINGLLTCIARVWQMCEGTEGMLEILHSLAVGRP
jgi:hypothetical protein